MHELSITQGIIEISEQHAGGRRVRGLVVEIGELSGVVPEAVEFAFEACSQGTLLEGARLNIVRIPGRGHCRTCTVDVPLTSLYDACPTCGEYGLTAVSGEEMRVREIEVDD